MRSGSVYITVQWVRSKRKLIEHAIPFQTFAESSPRRILVESAREEFRYSENTLPIDIWQAIVRVYNEHF